MITESQMQELTAIRTVLEDFFPDLTKIAVDSGVQSLVFAAAQVASAVGFITAGQVGGETKSPFSVPALVKGELQ